MTKLSLLNNGMIPAHAPCPFKAECKWADGCLHKGEDQEGECSCGAARMFDMLHTIEQKKLDSP